VLSCVVLRWLDVDGELLVVVVIVLFASTFLMTRMCQLLVLLPLIQYLKCMSNVLLIVTNGLYSFVEAEFVCFRSWHSWASLVPAARFSGNSLPFVKKLIHLIILFYDHLPYDALRPVCLRGNLLL
jgi:hypothetical protein